MWLQDQRCEKVVAEAWTEDQNGGSASPINACLDLRRYRSDAWDTSEYGHVGKEILNLQKRLKWLEMQPASSSTIKDIRETRVELNCWLEREDAMWRQRKRLNWFWGGDRNTRFFRSKASARFLKNFVDGVFNPNEVWQKDDSKIEKCFVDYYTELFTSSNPVDFSEIIEVVQPKVSQEMNSRLLREFQPSEVLQALKQMYPLKAPRPDGISPFFQHF